MSKPPSSTTASLNVATFLVFFVWFPGQSTPGFSLRKKTGLQSRIGHFDSAVEMLCSLFLAKLFDSVLCD